MLRTVVGQGLRVKGKAWLPATPLVSVLDPGGNKSCFLQPIWNQSSYRACSLYLENGLLLTSTVSQTEGCHHLLPVGKPSEISSDRQASQALMQELGGLQEKSGFDLPP